jgi:HSP20 family molecular chaperone IbpA
MTVMTRWDAFHDLSAAQDQMTYLNRMLAQAVVTVELPGIRVGDLEIAFQDGLLTIQGERPVAADSAKGRMHLIERRHGQFRRSITLPQHVIGDAIEASTEDGVLCVVVPKVEEAKPRRIDVRAVKAMAAADAANGSAS